MIFYKNYYLYNQVRIYLISFFIKLAKMSNKLDTQKVSEDKKLLREFAPNCIH